ncbi:phage tail protein [Paracidovorax avenae]|uniref:phage tail protein n=1 Tax=Paracidovorax avenae TaxID=80867 RepID=UPI000D21A14D|nr:phage tail protein [Paracidovorax avenae]AVS66645.1 phage tail protein [Paracidovorax avenae]
MLKPPSLRDHLVRALPDLARDPGKLVLTIGQGSISSRATGSLAFEYSYTLQVLFLDYAGHADAIIVPLLIWLYANQPDALDNVARQDRPFRFLADYLSPTTADIAIELDLTERVIVRPRTDEGAPDGALNVIHLPEPEHPAFQPLPEEWSLWFCDELLATWDHDPRP